MNNLIKKFHIHYWNYQFTDKKGKLYYHCRCGKFKIINSTKFSRFVRRLKNGRK